MARHRRSQPDSLELLLDTICNTFGGILFVALLVVLMIQNSEEFTAPEATEPPRPEEIEELRLQSERLQSELASVESARLSQERLIEGFAREEIQALLQNKNDLQEQIIERQQQQNKLVDTNAKLSSDIEQRTRKVDEAESQLVEMRRNANALEDQLSREKKSRDNSTGVPLVQADYTREEVGIFLQYDRMYVWHRYDSAGRQLGLNTDDFVVTGERSGDLNGALRTKPIPTAGTKVSSSPESQSEMRRKLQQFDPRRKVIAVIVRPDSFDVFRHFRDLMKEMGFDYRLLPTAGPVADRGGSGGNFQ